MRTRPFAPITFAAMLALFAGLALAGVAMAKQVTLSATLSGGATETPPGDPDGSGTASVTVDPDTGKVCWNISVSNIADATQSHIHVVAAGVSGDVVVPLDVDGFSGSTQGCVEGQDKALLAKIIGNPAGYYVNVHTADFKAGAVRGQLAAGAPNTALAPPAESPHALLGALLLLAAALLGLRLARPIVSRP
jgi:CHRD domain-containing protein